MQARHEFKHSLNFGDYTILRARLRHVMSPDPHSDANGEYRIRSLYFDTPGDRALREKIDGLNKREKFRIRRYFGAGGCLMLEKKSKSSSLCWKQSERITVDEAIAILNSDLSWMAGDPRELLRELNVKMRCEQLLPKTVVDYIREPFLCSAGNVRVTLDRDIRTGLFSTDFLDDSLPTVKAGNEMIVMEVKYDQFIPDHIVHVLQLEGRQASAISKYALCRVYG